MPDAPVTVDCSCLQAPSSRGRGIGRYALAWCEALERERPDLVGAYLLSPDLPPPGRLGSLLQTGKVHYRTTTPEPAAVFHQLSPFDLDQPIGALLPRLDRGTSFSATVYDLIPAEPPWSTLMAPGEAHQYRARLELVRAADHLLCLSDAVASDCTRLLGVAKGRCAIVGAAPTMPFPRAATAPHAEGKSGPLVAQLDGRPYVCYPSGSHPRKNNEALVEAWASLRPDERATHKLVVAGDLDAPTANHLLHLAATRGAPGEVVVPGYLADEDLVALVAGASLVCFPSLAEGFGLPIVEALAIGVPTIASRIAAHEELLDPELLFDASDQNAMAAALKAAICDPPPARPLPAARQTWQEVAQRSAAVFDRLARERPRLTPIRQRRARIAVVTPLPPAPSGVARYSYQLLRAMAERERAEIVAFFDGPVSTQRAPSGIAGHRVEALASVERLEGPFDEVVYVVGNSHHHLGALDQLRQRAGVVLAHDVRLSNLYRHANGEPGLRPGGLARDIARIYGDLLPSHLGRSGDLSLEDLERYGLLLAREVVDKARCFLVTSTLAARLASIDARPEDASKICQIPFAISKPAPDDPNFEEPGARPAALASLAMDGWGAPPPATERRWLGHFGIVDPIKAPERLIESLVHLSSHPGLCVVFVGPISESVAASLVACAQKCRVSDRVLFTGPLPPRDYAAWIDTVDVAIQLRTQTNGEASAAVGECLAGGIPTIVSDLGWCGELPGSAVRRVPAGIGAAELAKTIAELIGDGKAHRARSAAALAYAARHGFDEAATALLDICLGNATQHAAGTTQHAAGTTQHAAGGASVNHQA